MLREKTARRSNRIEVLTDRFCDKKSCGGCSLLFNRVGVLSSYLGMDKAIFKLRKLLFVYDGWLFDDFCNKLKQDPSNL